VNQKYDTRVGNYPRPCIGPHAWQPISFRFEQQLLDPEGRVQVRQPDPERGRVYVVCMRCHRHTYIETLWAGYCLVRPDDQRVYAPGTPVEFRRANPGELDDCYMTWEKFVACCQEGALTDYDGYGELATDDHRISNIRILPRDALSESYRLDSHPAWATHVRWYNK
jgi:hypothetical protein